MGTDDVIQNVCDYTFLHITRFKFDTPLKRSIKRGGRVGLIYQSTIHVEHLKSGYTNFTHFEHVVYYVMTRGAQFSLCAAAAYRPPPSKRNGFTKDLLLKQWSAFLDTVLLDRVPSMLPLICIFIMHHKD